MPSVLRCTLFPYTTLFRSMMGPGHLGGCAAFVLALGAGFLTPTVAPAAELVWVVVGPGSKLSDIDVDELRRVFLGTKTQWGDGRSEEHTSELQSLRHLVCRPCSDVHSFPTRRSSDL